MNTLVLLAFFLILSLVLQVGVLLLSARICDLPKRSLARVCVVVFARFLLLLGLLALLAWLVDDSHSLSSALLLIVFDAILTVLLVRRLFGGRLPATLGACAINLVLGGMLATGLVFGLREFLGTYEMVSSAMSPSLRGYHTIEVLPDGNHLIIAATTPGDERGIAPGGPSGAIVAETYEYREATRSAKHTHIADRLIYNKTKSPVRWDATVFRYPPEPSIVYVKRLVGLPGERLEIREGCVWINGERMKPPDRLGPIRYSSLSEVEERDPEPFVVNLGPDEYFLLGDNTRRTADSRVYGAIKREFILGVADLIYWPPSRWKVNP